MSDTYSRSDSQNTISSKMDPDKAAIEVAERTRLLLEAFVDQVKLSNKKDVVLDGFRQRLATYEKHGGQNAHDPAVAEAWRKHRIHYMQEEEKFKRELAKVHADVKHNTHNFASVLVKSQPTMEIKERQLIDALKLEMAKDRKSAPEDRISKLEKQMASVLESQKAQEANMEKLKKENEELRTRIASLNAPTADLALLKTQQEQIQLQISTKPPQDAVNETLKQEKEALASQVSVLQARLTDLVQRVDSQHADLTKSLQEATTRLGTSTAPGDSTSLQELKIVQGQVQALEEQVEKHEDALRDIDAEEYTQAVTKLIKYPDYPELQKTIQDQQSEIQRLGVETKGLSSNISNAKLEAGELSKRLTAYRAKSDSDFREFSNKIVEACAGLVQNNEKQIIALQSRTNSLETQFAATSRGPSTSSIMSATSPRISAAPVSTDSPSVELREVIAINTSMSRFREDCHKVQNALSVFQQEVRERHNALEMMIMSLDEQFKNVSTTELASIILDNLKRLSMVVVPLDVQNFHERLVDLEMFRQEQTRRGLERKDWIQTWTEDLQNMTKPKRGFAEDDDGLEQPEKRQRVQGAM